MRLRDTPLGTCKQRKERRRRIDLNGFISPPKRRKGKKTKRSLSMEDVSRVNEAKTEVVIIQQPDNEANVHQENTQWWVMANA